MKIDVNYLRDINAVDANGWTALMHASWYGYTEIMNLLESKLKQRGG